jgi:alanine-glyoxylate transaminase/serine-glyoxylate transaminase/serine-pyruvate transaminase
MNIGPTRLSPRVRACLGQQPPPLYDSEFISAYRDCLRRVRDVVGAPAATVLAIPGTGTSGLEAAVANLIPAGVSVTVASTGQWGYRWADICERLGHRAYVAVARAGQAADIETVDRFLTHQGSAALLVTHVDSSSSVRTDLRPLAQIAHRHGAMLFVDGVCAAGAEAVGQATTAIDVYISSPPKALSAPAGLSIISLLPHATALLQAREWGCPSYSHDLQAWLPVMQCLEEAQFTYFQTPASNLILALAEALTEITEEGVTARVTRHRRLRDELHTGLKELGLSQLVTDPALRANGVTVCWYPEGRDPAAFLGRVRDAGVLLPTGTHPVLANRTFRIGHLGNVTKADIDRTLTALAVALGAK